MLLPKNTIIASLAFSTSTAELAGWRADLEWDDLASKLSPAASIIDTSFADFLKECTPEFFEKSKHNRTNHALTDQPSGMCLNSLFCAYERCYPRPDDDGHASTTISQRHLDFSNTEAFTSNDYFSELRPDVQSWLNNSSNPSLNLPSKVLFPAVASDIVAAIMFAKQHHLEISVKNSGHSTTGASTKRDTLHINMNRYKQYAPTGITDCDVGANAAGRRVESTADDLSNQPCHLAVARDKPATIRVGGGENWDKVFRAVKKANKVHDKTTGGGYKYHMVGGAAGTVSPMGWTFQGGLGATVGGRMFGFGVDQILQVEMILPNGHHVRFGPTEWEDASEEGFTVPRTTFVSGVCRDNPEEPDEDQWIWSGCPTGAHINFDDLWFAVSGGGGGTWGVVTSMHLQLHNYLPLALLGQTCLNGNFTKVIAIFQRTFILLPSRLNITQSESDACGCPGGSFMLTCVGKDAGEIAFAAWKRYVESEIGTKVLSEEGISAADVLPCYEKFEYNDFAEVLNTTSGPYIGKLRDDAAPTIRAQAEEENINVLIPKKWIEENPLTALWLLSEYPVDKPYFAFGDGTTYASDQANSLSSAHRGGGFMVPMVPEWFFNTEALYNISFSVFYNTSDKENFPAFIGANHAGANMVGPRKDDWNTACPTKWTQKERDEKCISFQEITFGTNTMLRLEAIKEAVDPNYMFNCNGCIGNNRVRSAVPSAGPSAVPSAVSSAAPSAALSAPPSAALSAPPSAVLSVPPSAISSSTHFHHESCMFIFPIILRLVYWLLE